MSIAVLDLFLVLLCLLLLLPCLSCPVLLCLCCCAARSLPLRLLLCLFRCPGLLCVVVVVVVVRGCGSTEGICLRAGLSVGLPLRPLLCRCFTRRTRDRVWLKCEW